MLRPLSIWILGLSLISAQTPSPAPTTVTRIDTTDVTRLTTEEKPSAIEEKPNPIDVKPTGDHAVRLQIFLDEAIFGPGVIDGKPGRFTELAVAAWNERHGHPTASWTAVNQAAQKAVSQPTATALVPEMGWPARTITPSRSGGAAISSRLAESGEPRSSC